MLIGDVCNAFYKCILHPPFTSYSVLHRFLNEWRDVRCENKLRLKCEM